MNKKILELIKNQLYTITDQRPEYSHLRIIITNELQYNEERDSLSNDTLYIVVKFMPGTVNFGQNTIPVTFNVISTHNQINICQQLLLEYITKYNLVRNDNETILQTYSTPSVSSNFNDVYEGYRSLYYFTGTFIVSEKALHCTIKYKNEIVEFLTESISATTNLDTQAFYTTHNFTNSEVLTGTLTLSVSTFFVNNIFCVDVLNAFFSDVPNINKDFVFEITFKGIPMPIIKTLKIVNLSFQENIGEIPVASMSFTE